MTEKITFWKFFNHRSQMGQYWKAANLDKKLNVEPDGWKLMEHAYYGDETVEFVCYMLAHEWANERIVWVGDYADDYTEAYNDFEEFCEVPDEFDEGFDSKEYYLVNLDKKIYVDLGRHYEHHQKKFASDYSEFPHPLPILTAVSNGLGGGDFRDYKYGDDHPMVGDWAGDRLRLIHKYSDNLSDNQLIANLKEARYEFSETKPEGFMDKLDVGHIVAACYETGKEPIDLTMVDICGVDMDKYLIDGYSYEEEFKTRKRNYIDDVIIGTHLKGLPDYVKDNVNVDKVFEELSPKAVEIYSSDGKTEFEISIEDKNYILYLR